MILGLACFLRPIKVKHATIKKELPILVLVTTVFSVLMLDRLFNPLTRNSFSRADGIILILLFLVFVVYLVQMLFHKPKEEEEEPQVLFHPLVSLLFLAVSIVVIIFSSDLIVTSAKNIAYSLNISEKIITMFAVVIGTSLPEMVMTVSSARKGEFDIAIGNIIGTNIFNICIVLGLPTVIYGDVLLTGFGFVDILAVFLSSFLLFLFARSERTLSKKEGIIMLLVFLAYYIYLLV